jgi:surface antigen
LSRYVHAKLSRRAVRRRVVRFSLVAANVLVLAVILAVVIQHPRTDNQPVSSNGSVAAANPLDQLSSVDIAQTVAQLNGLPETVPIANQAQSQAADVAIASSDNNVVSKPQVVDTALKSRADIQTYTAQAGDSIASLAAKFGVTSSSILWSNGLNASTVAPGTKLNIPPVNGIVYTVKAGDTPASLAARYSANADQIIAYNDAEISGLQPGEQIIIPNATQAVQTTGGSNASSIASGFPWGSGPLYGFNGYDYGYCTWYVATQVPVPANWGNASSWAYFARMSGWNVGSTPTVGAIAQKGGGEGHVAIVTGVNPDGSVTVRDMNGFAGWGRVGTGTVSAGFFQNFITR